MSHSAFAININCPCQGRPSENNPIAGTTADFNAFHALRKFQQAQIQDANYETTLQKCECCPFFEGNMLNMKISKESIKNLNFIQMLSILTNPVPDKDQIVTKIWQGKEGMRKDFKG